MINCAGNWVAFSQTYLEAVCSDLTRVDKFLVASPKERISGIRKLSRWTPPTTTPTFTPERVLLEQELDCTQELGGSLARAACLQKMVNPLPFTQSCLYSNSFLHLSTRTDNVPPLEDMSDYLQQLKTKQSPLDQLPSKKPTEKKHIPTVDSSLLELENREHQSSKNLLICDEAKRPASSNSLKQSHSQTSEPQSSTSTGSKSSSASASFGGMKKGFLFGSGSKPQKKAAPTSSKKTQSNGNSTGASSGAGAGSKEEEQVPFLKAQHQEKQAGMRLDEVQEEMKKAYPLLQTQGT